MDLRGMINGLVKEAGTYTTLFAQAKERRPALAPFATPGALAKAMQLGSKLSDEERIAVTIAVVAEQHRAPHPLWQALLVCAYEPMLRRLRGRTKGGDAEELEQQILIAFLEAVRALPVLRDPSKAAVYLRTATERAVFRHVHERRSEVPTESFDEEALPVDARALFDTEHQGKHPLEDVARAVQQEPNAEEIADVLVATLGEGESLFSYVARTRAHLTSRERDIAYWRLQRQRQRVLGRIRANVSNRAERGEEPAASAVA
jgi:hypothetical protein